MKQEVLNRPLANAQQLRTIGAMCARLGIDKAAKMELVMQYSFTGETSSRYLTFNEANELISNLARLIPQSRNAMNSENEGKRKMLGKLFYYGHEMGLITSPHFARHGSHAVRTESGKQAKKDYSRFHDFIEKKGYLKKNLNRYTFEELQKLVSQVENIYRDFLKKY